MEHLCDLPQVFARFCELFRKVRAENAASLAVRQGRAAENQGRRSPQHLGGQDCVASEVGSEAGLVRGLFISVTYLCDPTNRRDAHSRRQFAAPVRSAGGSHIRIVMFMRPAFQGLAAI